MNFLTDFGDSALLLPLSAVVLAWLAATQPIRAALWWTATLIFVGFVMGALKIVFFACPPAANITSPSGHTAFALAVYGGLAIIVCGATEARRLKIASLIAGFGLSAGIAWSRVALRMHSTPEILIGFAVGTIAILIFAHGYPRDAPGHKRYWSLALAVGTAIFVFHGSQLNPENNIHAASRWLQFRGMFCAPNASS